MKQYTGFDFFKHRTCCWLGMGVTVEILRAMDIKVINYFVHYYGPYEEVNWVESWITSLKGGPCMKNKVVIPWFSLCF